VNVLSREDRLATLERMGLPDSGRFSHATIMKIAGEADADAGGLWPLPIRRKTATLEARVLHLSPPSLSPPLKETKQHAGSAPRACPSGVADFVRARSEAMPGTRREHRMSPSFSEPRLRCVLSA